MARIFPIYADGDELTPADMNLVFAELERWRGLMAMPPITIEGATSSAPPVIGCTLLDRWHLQLTGNGSSGAHYWQEVIWSGSAWVSSGVSRGSGDGDAAYELQGLNCPEGDEVLEAWRDNYGRAVFRAVPIYGITSGTIAAGSVSSPASGSVEVYSPVSGTIGDSGLSVTAYNLFATSLGSSKGVKLTPWNGKWTCGPWDC